MTPATMGDLPRTTHVAPKITVYGPPECPNCDKAMKLFDRKGISATKISVHEGDENHVYVKKTLGYETAPVIIVELENGRIVHWGGHRPDMLTALTKLCTTGLKTDQHAEEAVAS
jgi:glutaredoxin-like protein NrdH